MNWTPNRLQLPADGREYTALTLHTNGADASRIGALRTSFPGVNFVATDRQSVAVRLRTPVAPHPPALLRIRWGRNEISVPLEFTLATGDAYGDGTPDFLRLHSPQDRAAFRGWFTLLAEQAASEPTEKLPAEINDCAALLRYCYRESLRAHNESWLAAAQLPPALVVASVQQYSYPETPLGAALYRVTPGSFMDGPYTDLRSASQRFSQFADAETLMRDNAYLLTRDVHAARPGDLLFFRQLEQSSPYHSMIVTGGHDLNGYDAGWVVYHTGPIGRAKGEIRRVALTDLLHHPDGRWRPVPDNTNFLGVYRWNILREGD